VRLLFAFDPQRRAVFLMGGDKSGNVGLVQDGDSASGRCLRRALED
jgi:hypothetical protein